MFLYIIGSILLVWGALTIYVEVPRKAKMEQYGFRNGSFKAIVLYDPDPIYNLDAQVCRSFAEGFVKQGGYVDICSVAGMDKIDGLEDYDLYVFCANTYNFSPNFSIKKVIRGISSLKNKQTVAITVGSGSTKRAKRVLEDVIKGQEAILLASEEFWLFRPNDESRLDDDNVLLAKEKAYDVGFRVGEMLLQK